MKTTRTIDGMIDRVWEPDPIITEAVLDGRRRLRDLSTEDAEWAVATMSVMGRTVTTIAELLGCTPRHVKRIRARDTTQLMIAYAIERQMRLDAESRAAEATRTARRATAELERATGRADRLEREALTRRPRVA